MSETVAILGCMTPLVLVKQQGNVSMRLEADSQMTIVPPLGKLAVLVRLDGCLFVCLTLGLQWKVKRSLSSRGRDTAQSMDLKHRSCAPAAPALPSAGRGA